MTRPVPGSPMPTITLSTVDGDVVTLGGERERWQATFVYRGLHCPICKAYLARVEEKLAEFAELNTDVVIISGDPKEKAEAFVAEVGLKSPVGYDLSVAQMKQLGLYVSAPRSDAETDRPFAEPGLFITNPEGTLYIVEIANAPFIRPEVDLILRGLKVSGGGYPVRGTMA